MLKNTRALLGLMFLSACAEEPAEWFTGAHFNIFMALSVGNATVVWNEKTKQPVFAEVGNDDDDTWSPDDHGDGRHTIYLVKTEEEIARWKVDEDVRSAEFYPSGGWYDNEDIILPIFDWEPLPYGDTEELFLQQMGAVTLHELGHFLGRDDIVAPHKPTIMEVPMYVERNLDSNGQPTIQPYDVQAYCEMHVCLD